MRTSIWMELTCRLPTCRVQVSTAGNLDVMAAEGLACCVCLDALESEKALLLPCCGRESSSTRCCRDCLIKVVDSTGICPMCRTAGLSLNLSGRPIVRIDDGSLLLPSPTRAAIDRWLLLPLWRLLLLLLGVILSPLEGAMHKALEAAFSRGPT